MSRNYCITFFNEPKMKQIYCDDTEEYPIGIEEMRYIIIGEEICPKTKKKHWHAYVEFFKPKRIAGVKKLFKDLTIHCEKRRGTREQARDYCKKEQNYEEFGKWISGQGHRTDLEDIIEELQNGKKLSEVMMENPKTYCRYRNGLKDIASNVTKNNSKEFRQLEVTLLTGPTGCGKTREAMKNASYKIQGSQLAWWQDYEGEESIIIDEYSNDIKITELLAILDGYQLRLNIKGSHTYANWTKVYITTNLKPDELHKDAKPAHKDALFRRITKIENFWPCNEEVQG